jgi:methylmalonyl-CoA mutase N-terminal domain/subunit
VTEIYNEKKLEDAEERQIVSLKEVKRSRDNRHVLELLGNLKQAAQKEDENLFPHLIDCAKAYTSEQEICDVLREVFGEYEEATVF